MIKDRNIADDAAISITKSQGMGGVSPFTGEVFYVAKSGINAHNWLRSRIPKSNFFTTVQKAIDASVASRGDVIYVAPGHTETISAAGTITINKANISIIGLGNGNYRPVFTWSATASTIAISAANVLLKNIITAASVDVVVSMFNITGAGVTLDTVDYQNTSTNATLQFVLTTNAADQLTIKNCNHYQLTAAGSAQKWIQLVGCDQPRIINNTIYTTARADVASICISGSTAVVDCEIVGNRIAWLGATITSIINCVTGSTGVITDNRCFGGAAVLLAAAVQGDGCLLAENYVHNTASTSGILAPAGDVVT
jgi:hypothetical protein